MTRRAISGGILLALAISVRSWGQDADGPFPKFKDGVSFPPLPAVVGAPFDVVKLFAAPPLELNAAPLYLDALYEFGMELRGCFPDGPENDARYLAIQARHRQENEVEIALGKDPKSVPNAEIDAMLANYTEGFRKLAEAQLREQCVFQTGIGVNSLLPHVQAARQVARVAGIKIRRELDRGQVDDAIADVKTVLRLSRDLEKRGYLITHLVVAAIETATVRNMIGPILVTPGLTPAQCDSLMGVLEDFETKSIDPYPESLMTEYISVRITLWDLIKNQPKFAKAMGVKPGASVVQAVVGPLNEGPFRKGDVPPGLKPLDTTDVDEKVAATTPEEFNQAVGQLNTYYEALLALKNATRLEQIRKLPKPEEFFKADDNLTVIIRAMQPSVDRLGTAFGRCESTFRAYIALTAVRRWQLTHNGASPTDLEAASKAAGLKSAPIDPFDGKPLKLVTIDGEPVVYSIGKDGKDDGGKMDSDFDRAPGDLTFRLASKK